MRFYRYYNNIDIEKWGEYDIVGYTHSTIINNNLQFDKCFSYLDNTESMEFAIYQLLILNNIKNNELHIY